MVEEGGGVNRVRRKRERKRGGEREQVVSGRQRLRGKQRETGARKPGRQSETMGLG